MISLDYITLLAFFKENIDYFIGARLQKIQQPTRRDFLLTFRNLSESRKLYVNINPLFYHLCFVNDETIERRNISIPKQPPMFCMLLRKYLDGACVIDVRVPDYERILEFDFKTNSEFSDENNILTLSIEMMGKYSNIILYNTNSKIILGCAHNVGAEKSREREVSGTLSYTYPPKQEYKTNILRYNGRLNYSSLNKDFLGISKNFENLVNGVSLEKIKDYVSVEADVVPAINENNYSVYAELLDKPVILTSVNKMLDEYYSKYQQKLLIQKLYQKLKSILNAKYKKVNSSLKKIQYQLKKSNKGNEYKRNGDLILSNLYNGKDYSSSILVKDWKSNQDIKIELDKNLTLKENSQKYYKLYAKYKSSQDKLEELEKELLIKKEYCEQIDYSLNNSNDLYALEEIEEELSDNKSKTKIKESKIEEVEINGFKVYIGKNNKQNDLIISKISRGEDYWFHVHNMTGSHVLLKVNDSIEPDEKTLYECCRLAKKYSSAALSGKTGVIYTKRKFIKKPPAANPGYVIYKNETEVFVDK